MSFTESFNTSAGQDPTIASVSFAVPKIGQAFQTASYGGNESETNTPSTGVQINNTFTL